MLEFEPESSDARGHAAEGDLREDTQAARPSVLQPELQPSHEGSEVDASSRSREVGAGSWTLIRPDSLHCEVPLRSPQP